MKAMILISVLLGALVAATSAQAGCLGPQDLVASDVPSITVFQYSAVRRADDPSNTDFVNQAQKRFVETYGTLTSFAGKTGVFSLTPVKTETIVRPATGMEKHRPGTPDRVVEIVESMDVVFYEGVPTDEVGARYCRGYTRR